MIEIGDLQRLFAFKPNNKNISSVKNLETFIQAYPNEQLKPSLYRLLETNQYYRPVNGDGNCLYRAIMFLYLREADLYSYKTLFAPVDLLKCKKMPFKVGKTISSQHLLEYLWKKYLLPLAKISPEKREKEIEDLMNRSLALDSILVAYFRMLNFSYLAKNRAQISPYTTGGIDNDLKRIQTFGMESEGVQIYTLSKSLDISIEITMAHKDTLQVFNYNQKLIGNKFKLFYRPGHYDIIDIKQRKSQINEQRISFSQFYKMRNGQMDIQSSIWAPRFSLSSRASQSASKIISVSKPQQIRLLPQLNPKGIANGSRKKEMLLNQFKDYAVSKINNDKKNKMSQESNMKQLESKAQQTHKTIVIKCAYLESMQENKKAQMIQQGIICVLVLLILGYLVFGF